MGGWESLAFYLVVYLAMCLFEMDVFEVDALVVWSVIPDTWQSEKLTARYLHSLPEPDGFSDELHKTFKELPWSFSNSSKKLTMQEYFQTHHSIPLLPKLEKDTKRKENYRPISLVNTDAKFSTKCYFKLHIKRIIHHSQMKFIPGIQGWFKSTQINKYDTPY